MAKKDTTETPAPEVPAKPEVQQRLGLELLKYEYADKKTGEPTALQWKQHLIGGDVCGIVSKFGTLVYPDGSIAKFTHAEAIQVKEYLMGLRPNDEIQITNLQ